MNLLYDIRGKIARFFLESTPGLIILYYVGALILLVLALFAIAAVLSAIYMIVHFIVM